MSSSPSFILNNNLYSKAQLSVLIRELASIEEYMGQAKIRSKSDAKIPTPSNLLEEIAHQNNLNLMDSQNRQLLQNTLTKLKESAPAIHISFAVEPSPRFIYKLIEYMRKEIHPYLLFKIGLQPTIGAGCVIRTNNKYFDLSLRNLLKTNKLKLSKSMDVSKETKD